MFVITVFTVIISYLLLLYVTFFYTLMSFVSNDLVLRRFRLKAMTIC